MRTLGIIHARTTTNHPVANGIVEHFLCQLKAALKCHQLPDHWTDFLPLFLLGTTDSTEGTQECSTAELLYSTSLRLLGMFFTSPPDSTDTAKYVQTQKSIIQQLQSVPSHDTSLTIYQLIIISHKLSQNGRGFTFEGTKFRESCEQVT